MAESTSWLLSVSWAELKSKVQKELLKKLLAHYDKPPEEMRIALPLKIATTIAPEELTP
jgi:ribosomal protein L15E